MPHHGRRAGYNALLPYLSAARVVTVGTGSATRWLGAVTRRIRLGRPPGSDWWGAPSAWAELSGLVNSFRGAHVLHVMYGEDLLGLSSYLSSERRRVVATFHQPLERVEALSVPEGAVRRLDALIALDERAAEAWRTRFPGLPVHALRLGIDTEYWSPSEHPEARKRSCLVVGGHLRDFEVLEKVVRTLDAKAIEVNLVGVPVSFAESVVGLRHVRRHVNVEDGTLRELYRSTGVFLLCMRGASGNNALLQALATGCPIVCTDLAGVRSYAGASSACFVPSQDSAATSAAVLEILEARVDVSHAARSAAEAHSLPALAQRHWEVYRSLF